MKQSQLFSMCIPFHLCEGIRTARNIAIMGLLISAFLLFLMLGSNKSSSFYYGFRAEFI